jgi:phosphoglycerol transferase MdoB-like AlkP superfamily enzyme
LLKKESHLIWDACPFPPNFEPPRKEGSLFSILVNSLGINSIINYKRLHLVFLFFVFYIGLYVLFYGAQFILWMFTPHLLGLVYLSITSGVQKIKYARGARSQRN